MLRSELGFIYNREHNHYQCPAGKYLEVCRATDKTIVYRINSRDCRACNLSATCHIKNRKNASSCSIFRSPNQDFYEEQMKRMQETVFQMALKERMWKIEGINAEAKNLH